MSVTETFRVPKRRRNVPEARQRTREALAKWGVSNETAETAALLVSELVANAVLHCRVSYAQVQVVLTLDDAELTLEVSDPDRDRVPRAHESAPDDEGGRGLALVEALSDDWGWRQDAYTKCVWARIALEPSDAAGPSGSLVPGGARARTAAPAEPERPAHHDRVSP
ncbi:ATP-binding protein [Streptomyces sp. NPDC052077]|uniref:ATP-binding protein n=1 Tax=Streptomyces sp. NPDC052077 TaxID=3154757 RepID=UPI00343C903D